MKSNSKLVQSGLIVVVIGIWGVIGYRVYDAMSEDVEVLSSMYVPKPTQNDAVVTPIIQLDLDYNDPFTGKRSKRKTSLIKTPKQESDIRVEVLKSTPPSIIYNGYSYNAKGERRLAIKINGKLHFAQIGDTIEGSRIASASRDALQIIFEGKHIDVER